MVSSLRQRRDAQRKRRTRDGLLDAAKRVFVAKGYHATLISDIAAEAGTGQGTFYRHFDNKRQVVEVLFEEFTARLLGEFSPMSAHPPTDVASYLDASRAAVLRAARIALADGELLLLFLREGPSIDREFQQTLTGMVERFAALARFYLEHAIAGGFARPCDAELVSQSIVGIGLWQLERLLSGRAGEVDVEHVIDELVRFAFWGMGPPDGARTALAATAPEPEATR